MIEAAYQAVLHRLFTGLHAQPINWVITGSLGFALQGVPVEVNDIDLQTNCAGAYAIEQLFMVYRRRPVAFSATDRIASHFGALEIDGVPVEIMGDIQHRLPDQTWSAPVDLARHKRWVTYETMRLPVLSLEYECEAYRLLGRTEKAAFLQQWLVNQGGTME